MFSQAFSRDLPGRSLPVSSQAEKTRFPAGLESDLTDRSVSTSAAQNADAPRKAGMQSSWNRSGLRMVVQAVPKTMCDDRSTFMASAGFLKRSEAELANSTGRHLSAGSTAGGLAALGAIALAGAAIIVNREAEKADKAHPPVGAFVEIDGVRLHFVERGQGRPVVFLHGTLFPCHCYRPAGLWAQ